MHCSHHYRIFSSKLTFSSNLALVWAAMRHISKGIDVCWAVRMVTFRIWLALKQLVDKSQFEKLRFWGKILGTEKNYYIAEAEQNPDEEVEEEEEENNDNDEGKDLDDDEEGEGEEDPLPKSTYKPPPTVPKEDRGTGVNKYTYYVCNRRKFPSQL
jgi:hypothetical protein